MVIKHNLSAYNANRQFNIVSNSLSKSVEKLSSGYRINRAADDAAGLSISEKMRRQIHGITRGVENVQDGISLCQIADGALSEVNDMLNRISQLTIQASNDTLNSEDRFHIQAEINQLANEISNIGKTTRFNDIPIFDIGTGKTKEVMKNLELIKSDSASSGLLSEAYKDGSMYYPAAIMDFSALNEDTIPNLYDKSFSFTCSASCAETFKFTFINGNGNQSKFLNPLSKGTNTEHDYQIDIHNAETGEDVLNALFDAIVTEPPREAATGNRINVSHSNIMIKDSNNKLVIRASSGGNSDPQKAVDNFVNQKKNTPYGHADFADIIGSESKIITNIFQIQYGTEKGNLMNLEIERMNAGILGIDKLNVTTFAGQKKALTKTKEAMSIINNQRAQIGSEQNRLEHTVKNEENAIENTTAAESRIRDTDMATEMVQFTLQNALIQAGESILAQSNQNNQSILSLLE